MLARRLILLGAILVVIGLGSMAAAAPAAASRSGEPIVLSGSALAPLFGATREELSLWAWRGGSWQRVPLQMDERGPTGAYLLTEDGLLDQDDELVFLSDSLGSEAPAGDWPPGVEQAYPGLEVRASDPLAGGSASFSYLFRGGEGAPDSELWPPQVTYDPDAAEIRTASYVLGFARLAEDGFGGITRLSLFDDETDLVDRSKLRTKLRVLGETVELTEENMAFQGVWFAPALEGAGPVRAVIAAFVGRGMAYADRIVTDAPLKGLQLPGDIELRASVRISLDFSRDASPATYRDANVPDGVAVDGHPDREVAAAPMPPWREMVLSPGRLILLGQTPADVQLYYKDDSARDLLDTGDRMSFADNGVELNDIQSLLDGGFQLQMVVLPHDSPVTAEQLAEQAAHPLQVSVASWLVPATATSPPATAATPTATATTPTATATPTGPGGRPVYMPRLDRW